MMKSTCVAGLGLLAASGSTSAGFLFLHHEIENINGKQVLRAYAQSDNASDVLLSVFNLTAVATVDYFDSDLAGGSWAPQFTNAGDIATDSYLTIGGTPGFNNSTQADPGWGALGFTQPFIPSTAASRQPATVTSRYAIPVIENPSSVDSSANAE